MEQLITSALEPMGTRRRTHQFQIPVAISLFKVVGIMNEKTVYRGNDLDAAVSWFLLMPKIVQYLNGRVAKVYVTSHFGHPRHGRLRLGYLVPTENL
jgi:bifunctional DNase/RNase